MANLNVNQLLQQLIANQASSSSSNNDATTSLQPVPKPNLNTPKGALQIDVSDPTQIHVPPSPPEETTEDVESSTIKEVETFVQNDRQE